MRPTIWSLAAIAILSATGFGYWFFEHYEQPDVTVSHIRLPGFQTFPTPRTFDGPGTVFRIAEDRTKFPVTTLIVRVQQVGKEQFANSTQTGQWTLGALLKFWGAQEILTDPQILGKAGSSFQLTIQIGEGSRERTDDSEVAAALKAASIDYRDRSHYYVIRETIAVSEFTYRFARKADLTADIAAAVKKAAQARGNLKSDNSQEAEFFQKFAAPYRIFFTAEEIEAPTGLVGTEPKRRLVTEPLEWVAERR